MTTHEIHAEPTILQVAAVVADLLASDVATVARLARLRVALIRLQHATEHCSLALQWRAAGDVPRAAFHEVLANAQINATREGRLDDAFT